MNTEYIKTYMEVVRCGSFTKAEEILYLSKQAVMQQVNQLERELGAPLLARSRQGISMTPAGEVFYQEAIKLLALEQEMLSRVSSAAGIVRGLRLSHIDYHVLLVPVTSAYRQRYPDVQIQKVFHENTLEAELVAENIIDIGDTLYSPKFEQEGLCYKGLLKMPYFCIMPQGEARRTISLDELADRQVLVHDREFQKFYMDHLKRLQALLPHLEVVSNNARRIDVIYGALRQGKSVITASTFARRLTGCTIAELPVDFEQECGVVYRKDATREVLDYVHLACDVYYNHGNMEL